MKIAHILPFSVTFPLRPHNARHMWALELAQLQAQAGHDVTIYCNPQSVADGVRIRGIESPSGSTVANNTNTFLLAFSEHHDIYHSHFDNLHYEVAHSTDRPIVFTQHWWPSTDTVSLAAAHQGANVWAVPPTQYMCEYDRAHNIQTKGTIYHGINLSLFHNANVQKNGRILSVGRISPEKNLETSIRVAKKANVGLDIIGKITDKNLGYWETLKIEIDGERIRYLGEKPREKLIEHYGTAQAVLFPSMNEAFGLVAIEAQACGTPVIMAKGGSRGELVQQGVSGFLCLSDDEYVEAILKSRLISPSDCRLFAEKFDIQKMAANYEQLYLGLVS